MSLAWTDGFFTTGATWEVYLVPLCTSVWVFLVFEEITSTFFLFEAP